MKDENECSNESGKLCEINEGAGRLCHFLKSDEGIYVNHVLHTFLEDYNVKDLQVHFECAAHNCGVRLFHRFFSYLKLFKDVPMVQDRINDPAFPPSVLEKFVIFLEHYNEVNGQSGYVCIDQYLYFLKPGKIIDLIVEAETLSNDPRFLLHVLNHLDNKAIDALLARTDRIKSTLTQIFTRSEDEEVKSILFRNPILFDYNIMFLELDGRTEESEAFTAKYGSIINDARTMQTLVKEIRQRTQSESEHNRGERIAFIMGELSRAQNQLMAFEILKQNDAFLDEKESETVKMLIQDTRMRDFLDLNEYQHTPEEVAT